VPLKVVVVVTIIIIIIIINRTQAQPCTTSEIASTIRRQERRTSLQTNRIIVLFLSTHRRDIASDVNTN